MKNMKLLSTIGAVSDDLILEAAPGVKQIKNRLRKPVFFIAAAIVLLLLAAFTTFKLGLSDYWFQKPSRDPVQTVRSALENQMEKDYALGIDVKMVIIDEAETDRMVMRYTGSELARVRGWTDVYLQEHFVAVWAEYDVVYDHTRTFMEDGHIGQYFYLTQDEENGNWTIVDNGGGSPVS